MDIPVLLQGNARSGLGAGGSAGSRECDGRVMAIEQLWQKSTGASQKIAAIEMQVSALETLAGYVSREVAPAIKAASSGKKFIPAFVGSWAGKLNSGTPVL